MMKNAGIYARINILIAIFSVALISAVVLG